MTDDAASAASLPASLAAPLAAALAARGYTTLTPVQQAVLAPEAAGRDLLVSAQTGSGKTVAFGLALAPEVLAGAHRLEAAGERPLALAVAPTRELALQVARELEWLYAGAGAQVATCVGGMDFRTERRALARGAHIVVGTPGRLRDHIERSSLDLSAARAVVLDEADEMLDLGFAEDLAFILAAAPPARRTLMFSATVPPEIEKLAEDFQREALRLSVAGEGRQHADIAYRALSVPPRDREGAIFNLLRLHEAERAIVFCKTRANVAHLFARMVNRGFQVVALSGELSQGERTHALQALRDGRARVCIATDVAARGIDLPGLELVVHADLPSNAEVLLHRSGRTGRAGAKGTSVLVVTPGDFRKASRLLREAKVEAEWGRPPSADEVQAAEDARLLSHPALAEPPGEEAAMAEAILSAHGAAQVAAAFVRLWRQGRSAPEVLSSDALEPPPRAPAAPRDRAGFADAVWYEIGVGHEGRAEARWLLPKICEAGGVGKDAVGAIRVVRDRSFVQIAARDSGRFGAGIELEPGLAMTRLAGEPPLDRAAPAGRPSGAKYPGGKAYGSAHRGAGARDAAPEGAAPRPRPERAPYKGKPPRIVEDDAGQAAAPRDDAPPRAPRRPRPAEGGGEPRRPYAPRETGGEGDQARRPYPPRKPDGEGKRPYSPGPRAEGDRAHAPRPRPADGDGATRPYTPRPRAAEGAGDRAQPPRDPDSRPPRPRPAGDDLPPRRARWSDAPQPQGAPYGGEAPRKPRWKKGGPADGAPQAGGEGKPRYRSEGYKSHGGAAKGGPGRATGMKSHRGGDGAGPATGEAPRPYVRRPPKPPADPRDTSRRFVPPKKPKS